MPDSWRAIGRESSLAGEPVLLVEMEIRRTILFRQADFEKVKALVGDDHTPKELRDWLFRAFSGMEAFTRTFFKTDMPAAEKITVQTPWQPLVLSGEALVHLAEVLQRQEGEMWADYSGDMATGATITLTLGGRRYELTLRSSSQARAVKSELESVATKAKIGNLKKVFEFLREVIDWIGRWELAREVWERAKEAKEAREAKEKEDREFREKLREAADAAEPMDYDNMDAFDRASRTC